MGIKKHSSQRLVLVLGIALSVWVDGMGAAVSAATIVWGAPQTVSGESDVSTAGTLVYAYGFGWSGTGSSMAAGPVTDTTVNGVTFAAFGIDGGVVGDTHVTHGDVSIWESPGTLVGSFFHGATLTPYASLPLDYQLLLASGATGTLDGTLTLQLGGLTPGQVYDFQWWSNHSTDAAAASLWTQTTAAATDSVTLTANVADAYGGVGQYSVGRFTADGATQSITFDGVGGKWPLINGFQVRLAASAVPEIDPAGVGSVLALVAGTLSLLERRRS